MSEGIIWALFAGLMLGLYAIPGKFIKDFKEENTWGMFFMLTMFVVPVLATFILMKGVTEVFTDPEVQKVLPGMVMASVLWGIGVMLWGKAIHHIGVSLGFSFFIGTVILIGSLLPFVVEELPPTIVFATIIVGLAFVLAGVVLNAKAGITREQDEALLKSGEEKSESESNEEPEGQKSMAIGILIAVVGGLLATGFSFANTTGKDPLSTAVAAQGNESWLTAVAVMFPVFLSGGLIMAGYFAWQLSAKKAWSAFKTPRLPVNFVLIFIMAFFHYAASVVFAYAAFKLGKGVGDTVGYAIFNTACVLTAIVSGIATGEWKKASSGAKSKLYIGMACMVVGVLVIAVGKKLNADIDSEKNPNPADNAPVVEPASPSGEAISATGETAAPGPQ